MIFDVMLYRLGFHVADASAEFARRPKMATPKHILQVRECFAQFMRRPPFEASECFGDAEIEGQGNEKMDVIGADVHVVDDDAVKLGSPEQRGFYETGYLAFHEILAVFRAPLKMKLI
jgi:hypothetical protein